MIASQDTQVNIMFIYIANLKALIEDQRAIFSTSVSNGVTHLVTTQKDVEKKSAKCVFFRFVFLCFPFLSFSFFLFFLFFLLVWLSCADDNRHECL